MNPITHPSDLNNGAITGKVIADIGQAMFGRNWKTTLSEYLDPEEFPSSQLKNWEMRDTQKIPAAAIMEIMVVIGNRIRKINSFVVEMQSDSFIWNYPNFERLCLLIYGGVWKAQAADAMRKPRQRISDMANDIVFVTPEMRPPLMRELKHRLDEITRVIKEYHLQIIQIPVTIPEDFLIDIEPLPPEEQPIKRRRRRRSTH